MERAAGAAACRLLDAQAFYGKRHLFFLEDEARIGLVGGLDHLRYRYLHRFGCNQDGLRGKTGFPGWRLVMHYNRCWRQRTQ
jgi:hypothetical protein